MKSSAADQLRTASVDPLIKWRWLAYEFLLLCAVAALASWLTFSLLPLSVAILTWLLVSMSFPFLRKKLQTGAHVSWTFVSWILLNIFFYALIIAFGRAPFEWLLDWS